MPATWTTQQILALAPDASSAKSGGDLATPRKWGGLGANEQAVWGECLGSGSKPYQTQIDLTENAFKCSCPSRKFPCKHGLGLFLLLASQPEIFASNTPPAWVTQWIESRSQKRDKKNEPAVVSDDPEAIAKRAAKKVKAAAVKDAKVAAGMQELELWLRDLVRQGLATVEMQPYSFWDAIAARMWDAQASVVGNQLRSLASIPNSGAGWQERLLTKLSRLYLLTQSFKRLESLPPGTVGDIRLAIGWTQKKEDLLAGVGLGDLPIETQRDRWLVLWQAVAEVEGRPNLRSQRTWLWGQQSDRAALILDFAYGNTVFDISLVPGTLLDAELAFYPSAYPIRALIKTKHQEGINIDGLEAYKTSTSDVDTPGAIANFLQSYANALARNPWIEQFPTVLQAVIPIRHNNKWIVIDTAGDLLPIAPRFDKGWQLLALSGGQTLALFGEWDGDYLLPLNAWVEGQFVGF